MDSRLIAWTVALTGLVAAAAWLPAVGVAISLLAPLVALAWGWKQGTRAAALATLPGALLLGLLAPGALPAYVAAVMAGLLVARALRAGVNVGPAIALGTVPFAMWTVGLAISGFDPVSPDLMDRWEHLLVGVDSSADLEESTEQAIGILRNTWVASEILWFAGLLALGIALTRRFAGAADLPRAGRWQRLDLPDGLIAALIGGLALVLLASHAALTAVGWNLVFGTGALYALRGTAIEVFWMDRGSVSRGMRTLFFVGNVVLFLPVFLILTAVLGMLDTWFDFRRLKGSEGGSHPLSVFHQSSGDDLKE